MTPKDLALIVALGVGGVASTAHGAEIVKVGEQTIQPNIGYVTAYSTYKITVEKGDTLPSIVDQLNARGLRHEYKFGTEKVYGEDLLKQNPELDMEKGVKPGQVLEFTRVTGQYGGFTILL